MIGTVLPRPRDLRIDDPHTVVSRDVLLHVLTGAASGSDAWALLADERPWDLPSEGYVLRISAAGAVIAGADDTGVFRGRAVLEQLTESAEGIHPLTVRDWPELRRRGVVEGFYGPPWSHDDRVDFVRFAARVGLNEYVYAPKDDPYHREKWREPYPERELDEIRELVVEAEKNRVDFVYAISPALSMRYSDDAEHTSLAAKAGQLLSAGVRSFALLFDDVPGELTDEADVRAFGADAGAAGRAHGLACARFCEGFLRAEGVQTPLVMCPTDYAGCTDSPYRAGLRETLPADALVMWTGSDIVVGEVTRADIDAAAASYARRLVLWDNFPVNDFDRSRLFLGPLLGRTTDLEGSALVGISSNPMVEATPSHLALATVADWAWNPPAYDPQDSARRALLAVAGQHAGSVAEVVRVSSSWPPSASQSEHIEQLAEAALAGDQDALSGLEAALTLLARAGDGGEVDGGEADGGEAVATDAEEGEDGGQADALDQDSTEHDAVEHPLTVAMRPWLAAARDAGRAGALACALLRHIGEEHEQAIAAERDDVAEAQATADAHYPNVLRSVLPAFVRRVLERAGGEQAVSVHAHHRVSVLTGENRVPGDRDLSERLTARGFDVDLVDASDGVPAGTATDLVIVTPGASVEAASAAAGLAVPLLAWGRLDTLGLTTESGTLLAQETVEIVDRSHALAAGVSGVVRVYRGPGTVTWGSTAPDASVIARTTERGLPAIAVYPSGSRLPGGRVAPADRVLFFFGSNGLAPWLIAPEGHTLFNAAVDLLIGADVALSPASQ
ncbi:hypothetical protein GCM10027416_27370 [Okibacterium endophyticum]